MKNQSLYSQSKEDDKIETTYKSLSDEVQDDNFLDFEKEEVDFFNGKVENKFYNNIHVLGWTKYANTYKKSGKCIIDNLCEKLKTKNILVSEDLKMKILQYSEEFHKYLKKNTVKQKVSSCFSIFPVFYILLKNEFDNSVILDYNFFKYFIKDKKIKFNKYLCLFKKYRNENMIKSENEESDFKKKTEEMVFFWLSRILKFYEKENNTGKIIKMKKLFEKIFFFQDNFHLLISSCTIKYLSLAFAYILFNIVVDNSLFMKSFFDIIKNIKLEINEYDPDNLLIREIFISQIQYSTFQTICSKIKSYFLEFLNKSVFSDKKVFEKLVDKNPKYLNQIYFLKKNLFRYQVIWRKNLSLNFKIIFLAEKTIKKLKDN